VIPPGKPEDFTKGLVRVELEATATVAADVKTIALSVTPSVSKFEGFVEYGGPSVAPVAGSPLTAPSGFFEPVYKVLSTQADVSLQDGATLVVGLSEVESNTPVPMLGDIPLIGRLFQAKGETKEKRALLVFITVHVRKPGQPETPSASKFAQPTNVSP
jgi:general secretion pathway protein D